MLNGHIHKRVPLSLTNTKRHPNPNLVMIMAILCVVMIDLVQFVNVSLTIKINPFCPQVTRSAPRKSIIHLLNGAQGWVVKEVIRVLMVPHVLAYAHLQTPY